jgi:hypothetical protein
LEEECE